MNNVKIIYNAAYLADLLHDMHWTSAALADMTGYSRHIVRQRLDGTAPVPLAIFPFLEFLVDQVHMVELALAGVATQAPALPDHNHTMLQPAPPGRPAPKFTLTRDNASSPPTLSNVTITRDYID